MPNEAISETLLSTVVGGNPAEAAGPYCTPDDQLGLRTQRRWENSPEPRRERGERGPHTLIHPEMPPEIRYPRPPRPPITRSDRRLKRRIRAL